MTKYATQKPAMTETGPNDMRHVVWALGGHFPDFLCFLKTLTNLFVFIQVLITKNATQKPAMTKTGPNDGETRLLGIRWVFFFLRDF